MFIAALVIIAKGGGDPKNKYPSAGKWINKMYLAIKSNKVLTCATTWMNLENTLVKEVSHK